jgi:hypothetical protein
MSMPAQIADRVSDALGALYRHPNQTLLAWYRYAIYAAMVADQHQAGYTTRAWVDVLSARHVLFCWQPYAQKGWPSAWAQPADLLGLAEQTLQGMGDPSAVQRQISHAAALADMIGAPAASAQYPAWCVFEAALRALQSAWIAHMRDSAQAAQGSADAGAVGLDDASWYAAIAIAGGLPLACSEPRTGAAPADRGGTTADAAVRLRWTFFWEWWLREAIPQATLIARSSMVL